MGVREKFHTEIEGRIGQRPKEIMHRDNGLTERDPLVVGPDAYSKLTQGSA